MVPPGQTSHYFDDDPSAPSATRTVALVLPDLRLELTTDRGVFGRDRVDPGTKLLLLEAPAGPLGPAAVHDGPAVLVDVGAGYGPIACALALRNPEATVWAVEVNARARDLCRTNATAAGLTNVMVAAPDDVPDDLVVDGLWSNPPIRIGKAALHELVVTWLDRLGPGAMAHLVVQRHLGADSLARWLVQRGHGVERRASRQGYRLLDVTPTEDRAGGDGP